MNKFVCTPVLLDQVKSCKDKSLKITFTTPELPPDQGSIILSLANQQGFAYFSPNGLQESELIIPLDDDAPKGKTPGQRLRACIYVLWEQEGKLGEFSDYYQKKMERIITFVKDKLE